MPSLCPIRVLPDDRPEIGAESADGKRDRWLRRKRPIALFIRT
jgi:hypothetical protein